ncbi:MULTISPECIES: molecular chaperone [Desulfitobacterium]|uniref:Putative component of anaerobic dehydrogenase n=1 Tax=Desulfitobacterium dehalogenans (strain ATCC 51507 / DSM 9161 / JW/IU-DC1) TaxID=756499 RepID=I4A8J6_DESDJ|nr:MULTISPECIES: molecular chaperone TorD family protein [Desulfitobacterium]AFM00281.1 putative component of anaerobic dehydrogenase [Desulfitobacterium dehalogenans ATCC 51507]
MSITEEAKQITQVRGNIYTLLSQCFVQPSEDLVASLVQGSLTEALQRTLGLVEEGKVARELARVKDFGVQSQGRSPAEILQDMKVEYSRLFVGPGHVVAPPYESVYKTRDDDNEIGVVMGDAAIAAKRFYRSAGLELSDDFTDLPDHIALELYFMAYLCSLEFDMANEDKEKDPISIRKMQTDFLKTHLGSWITDLSQAVDRGTNSEFYRGVAGLTEVWIGIERDELE